MVVANNHVNGYQNNYMPYTDPSEAGGGGLGGGGLQKKAVKAKVVRKKIQICI